MIHIILILFVVVDVHTNHEKIEKFNFDKFNFLFFFRKDPKTVGYLLNRGYEYPQHGLLVMGVQTHNECATCFLHN